MNATLTNKETKLVQSVSTAPCISHTSITDWKSIDWKAIERYVFRLQQRIYRAEVNGQKRKVKQLQRLLLRSKASLLLAIRKVTQINKGKRSAGVDGYKASNESERLELYKKMRNYSIFNHNPKPTKRTFIPKKNGKLRPLSIPTIKDRIYQDIAKMALEPQWEARFESVSYGFRPKRGCHDAIEAIYNKLVPKKKKWIFEGDFKGCFDNLNHDHILKETEDFPANKIIRRWLKAGCVNNNVFSITENGTPQGGIISPLLANIALHGMEEELNIQYRKYNSKKGGTTYEISPKCKYSLVRYADDFVILCETKEMAESMYDKLKPYLQKRGLELAVEKTRITNVSDGFNFLGFNVRTYNDTKLKLLIKPSNESIAKLKSKIKTIFNECRGYNVGYLLNKLQPVITGAANYWNTVVSSEIFTDIDNYVFRKIKKFIDQMHPNKFWKWKKNHYFKPDNTGISKNQWILTDPQTGKQYQFMAWTPIVRHELIKFKNTPFNAELKEYFRLRDIKEFNKNSVKLLQKLARNQNYKCTLCGRTIINQEEGLETHHKTPRCQGGNNTIKNLTLVHTSCHILWHRIYPTRKSTFVPGIKELNSFRKTFSIG